MRILRLLGMIVCGLVLMPAIASNDVEPSYQFAGGNGLTLETAVVVVGKMNISTFAIAKLDWLQTQYPKSKTMDIEFRCIRGQRYQVHKIRLKSGALSSIYFDASNVSDETIRNGRVQSIQDLIDQDIAQVENSNLPPAQKQRMLSSMRKSNQSNKPGECQER